MKLEQAVLYYTITLETSLTSQLPSTTEGVDLASETSLKQKKSNGHTFLQTLDIAAGQCDPDLVDLCLFLQTFLLVRLESMEISHTHTWTSDMAEALAPHSVYHSIIAS